MKLFTLSIIFFLLQNCILAQSEEPNLEKYWAYRDRLHKNFLRVGDDRGESLPMAARRVGYPYNHANGDNPILVNSSSLYWSDGTIYLGHYIMVLATEYKLTNDLVLEGDLNEVNFNIISLP